jgi:hypothetical protein
MNHTDTTATNLDQSGARPGSTMVRPCRNVGGSAIFFLAAALIGSCFIPWVAVGEESIPAAAVSRTSKILPIPGEVFRVNGHTAFLIPPGQFAAGKPWVWYAPTLEGLPGTEEKWMFQKFLDAGLAVAGIDVGESQGNPAGRALFTALHQELVQRRGLSKSPCLLARSRGGLMLYNWAVENPTSVACVAGIYPVMDLLSYPGIKNAAGAYGMTEAQLNAKLKEHNPVDRLAPLAKARVPIYHLQGDSDTAVPLEKNSGLLAQRYRELGGAMTLNVIKGGGHTMWPGWFQCQELVDFVIAHALKVGPNKSSPAMLDSAIR